MKKLVWFPTLNSIPTKINSNSWFEIKNFINNKPKSKLKSTVNSPFLKTFKYKLYLNDNQKKKLLNWFDLVIKVYNKTNEYIKLNCLLKIIKLLIFVIYVKF
jgi:hypothetical protein